MTGQGEAGKAPAVPDEATSPMRRLMSDLGPRVASAIVMIAAALVTLWAGSDWFVLFWLVATLAVHWEWQNMIGAPAAPARMLAGGAALVLIAVLTRHLAADMALALTVAAAVLIGWLAGPGKRVWAGAGVVYAAGLVMSVTAIRLSLFDGLEAIVWLFAVVWGTDIMAYVGGRIIGGPKLWPRVSPKKTWAGFLTGVVCGAIFGVAAVAALRTGDNGSLALLFLFGLLTAVVSQGGDLFESSMKRHFGVKDSSNLIPGHGGVMDRLDGFLFAVVLAALIGSLRQGPGAVAIGVLRW